MDADTLLDAIADAIADHHGQTALVTEYVAVASFTDASGERHVYTVTLEEQRDHTTMGLLDFALALLRDRVARENRD